MNEIELPEKGFLITKAVILHAFFTIQILCWRNLCSNYSLVMSIMTYDVQWPWTPIDFRLFDVFVSGFNFLPYHKNCIQSHLNFTWPMKNPQVLSRWWFSLVRVNKCVNRNKRNCGVKELSTAVIFAFDVSSGFISSLLFWRCLDHIILKLRWIKKPNFFANVSLNCLVLLLFLNQKDALKKYIFPDICRNPSKSSIIIVHWNSLEKHSLRDWCLNPIRAG